MADTMYFAYGSNINLEQMDYRCPDATVIGPVTLENYELLFRAAAWPPSLPRRTAPSTACCGGSPRAVSILWIAMRATPTCMARSL